MIVAVVGGGCMGIRYIEVLNSILDTADSVLLVATSTTEQTVNYPQALNMKTIKPDDYSTTEGLVSFYKRLVIEEKADCVFLIAPDEVLTLHARASIEAQVPKVFLQTPLAHSSEIFQLSFLAKSREIIFHVSYPMVFDPAVQQLHALILSQRASGNRVASVAIVSTDLCFSSTAETDWAPESVYQCNGCFQLALHLCGETFASISAIGRQQTAFSLRGASSAFFTMQSKQGMLVSIQMSRQCGGAVDCSTTARADSAPTGGYDNTTSIAVEFEEPIDVASLRSAERLCTRLVHSEKQPNTVRVAMSSQRRGESASAVQLQVQHFLGINSRGSDVHAHADADAEKQIVASVDLEEAALVSMFKLL